MKCQATFIKTFIVFVFGIFVIGFSLDAMDAVVPYNEMNVNTFSCFTHHALPPQELIASQFSQTSSDPRAALFQILFILFIISPPLIVVMLYLIWKELKVRNKMKMK